MFAVRVAHCRIHSRRLAHEFVKGSDRVCSLAEIASAQSSSCMALGCSDTAICTSNGCIQHMRPRPKPRPPAVAFTFLGRALVSASAMGQAAPESDGETGPLRVSDESQVSVRLGSAVTSPWVSMCTGVPCRLAFRQCPNGSPAFSEGLYCFCCRAWFGSYTDANAVDCIRRNGTLRCQCAQRGRRVTHSAGCAELCHDDAVVTWQQWPRRDWGRWSRSLWRSRLSPSRRSPRTRPRARPPPAVTPAPRRVGSAWRRTLWAISWRRAAAPAA